MNWDDDLLLEGDDPDIATRGQFQFAMYALHLSCGNSIHCRSIKAATIEQYLLAAASFLSLFTGVDYRKDNQSDKQMGHILGPVLRDLKKFELVPNRREPYDPAMHLLSRRIPKEVPPDGLTAALVNGFERGYCAGHRLSEWAQPGGRTDPLKPQLNHLVAMPIRTRAQVPADLRILTRTKRRASGLAILRYPLLDCERMFGIHRTQKNGQHGEEKLFTKNPNPEGFCYVTSTYRSLQRFQRLMVLDPRLDPKRTPLSVYWDPQPQCVKLICATDIELFMCRLASTVYHLHPVKHAADLQKWSSHSLRVGACVALHAMGFSPLDIQWILRWRSTAFMVYLRNVAILANRHHQALDRAAALPFL
jgi:hypothetical protein